MVFCFCCENILPKTIVLIISTILCILGALITGVGIYTYVENKNATFFEAFVVEGFNSDVAETYIQDLRNDTLPLETLKATFDDFADEFDQVFREAVVKPAFKPSENKEENMELSYFLQGFRDVVEESQDPEKTTTKKPKEEGSTESKSVEPPSAEPKSAEPSEDGRVDLSNSHRKIAADEADRRRLVDELPAPTPSGVVAGNEDNPHYETGRDLAELIKDFRLNWVTIVIIGAVFLVMGAISCCALKDKCVAFLLAVLCFAISLFLIILYGQTQGWTFSEQLLHRLHLGAVLEASEKLQEDATAKLAIEGLAGYYKTWYLLVAAGITMVLAFIFVQLTFCSNILTKGAARLFVA